VGIEKGSTESQYVDNSLRKRLWTSCVTD